MNINTHHSLVSRQSGVNTPLTPRRPSDDAAKTGGPAAQQSAVQQGAIAQQSTLAQQSTIKVSLSQASLEASRVSASTAVAPVQVDKPANNPFANNILNAINGQLAVDVTDGATQEELQSRLEAGLSGFLSGFGEAFEQLSAMSEFTGDIKADVLSTKAQVLSGLAETAEQLGLDVTAITKAQGELDAQVADQGAVGKPETQTLKTELSGSSSLSAFTASQNTFSFELETADGDKIQILVDSLKAAELQANGKGFSVETAQQNKFELRIEGELDNDELKAINDLLNQVNAVSESFFGGNVEQAFDQAISMGYNSEEIQSFALKLTQTSFSQVQSTYGGDTNYRHEGEGQRAEPSKNLVHVGHFLQELEKANLLAEQMGQQLSIVAELADNIGKARELGQGSISDFINRLAS